jgi:type IX secretion system PorP/SprF family membrane protein
MKNQFNRYNKHLLLILALVITSLTNAQREPQYTQYINNTLTYNPAYISTQEDITITALGRSQWVGFEGAPKTVSFSAILPSLNKLGTGLNIIHDEIGATKQTSISGSLAYELQLNESIYTSFGISAGGSFLNVNYNDGNMIDANDPMLVNANHFDPNLGSGIMTYADHWYVGLSIPNFLKSKYYSEKKSALIATENLQYFILGGYIFTINDHFKFKPAVLARISKSLPFVIDYSANMLINKKVTVGISYRSSNILTGIFGVQLTDVFYLGYSYDRTFSNLNRYNTGSSEILLKITLPSKIKTIKSPRFY